MPAIACFICGNLLKNETALMQHVSIYHGGGKQSSVNLYNCTYCFLKFSSSRKLEDHKHAVHKNIDYFPCDYCTCTLKNFKRKIGHTKAVHGIVQLINCAHCPMLLKSHQDLCQHIENTHTCQICKIILNDKEARELHLRTIHPHRYCIHCCKIFADLADLNQHIKVTHKEGILCLECKRIFKKKSDLAQHTLAVHKVFRCTPCNRLFKKAIDLQQHSDSVHRCLKKEPIKTEDVENSANIPCNICSRLFPSESARHSHYEQAHTYQCRHCEKQFHDMIQLKQHTDDKHRNVNVFFCNHCTMEFTTEIGRYCHIEALHTFTCYVCFKKFNEAIKLEEHKQNNHLPLNVESKMFSCRFCMKVFNGSNLLEQHEVAKHKNIDYFPCEYCSEKFDSNISRRNHFFGIHSNLTGNCSIPRTIEIKTKQFICNYCLRSFNSVHDLRKHEIETHKLVKLNK